MSDSRIRQLEATIARQRAALEKLAAMAKHGGSFFIDGARIIRAALAEERPAHEP